MAGSSQGSLAEVLPPHLDFSHSPSTLLLEAWDVGNASAVEQENKSTFLFRALAQSSGTLKLPKCCMGV